MNRRSLQRALLVGGVACGMLDAGNGAAQAAGLSVSDAWIRFLTPEVPAGGYFRLRNTGDKPAVLTGARSTACGSLSLHQTILKRPMNARAEGSMAGGSMGGDGMAMDAPTMQMRPVTSVAVPAGGQVSFMPGGYHLMCEHPSATLHPGGKVTITLRFAGGEAIAVTFAVRGPRG